MGGEAERRIEALEAEVIFERDWETMQRSKGSACAVQVFVEDLRSAKGSIEASFREAVYL
jgi:hypothetical protein